MTRQEGFIGVLYNTVFIRSYSVLKQKHRGFQVYTSTSEHLISLKGKKKKTFSQPSYLPV